MDGREFTAFYRRHAYWLARYVHRIVGDADAAADICHDTLLKADGAAVDPKSPSAWLRSVAHNAALDHLRRARRTTVRDPAALDRLRESEDPLKAWGSSDAIHGAMAQLPTAQQQVIVLRYAHSLTQTDVATVLGKSPECIRQLESRALRALRSALEPPAAVAAEAVAG